MPATPQPNVLDTFGHGHNWAKWLAHLKDKPAVGLELGSFRGASAEWALENIFTHPNSTYTCVDAFEDSGSEEHKVNGIDCSNNEKITTERLQKFGERAWIFRQYSDKFLRHAFAPDNPESDLRHFDFVYVDAAHDSMNVLRDAVLAFDLMKDGGIMVFDDYTWNVMPREIDRPKMAIDSFLNCYADRLTVVAKEYQVVIKKIK